MKFECNKEKISSAISKAEKITGRNVSLPVLSCILIEAKDDKVKIKATNLDIGLSIEMPCKVSEAGVCAVSGSILNSYLSNLGKGDSDLNFSLQNENLYIYSKNSETTIKTLPAEDFPNIPVIEEKKKFVIESKDFLKGFQSVWYSASVSNIKPELSSVYIYPDGENIYFVATDSFRLAEKNIRIGKTDGFEWILIPFKNTTEIARIFEDQDTEVEVIFDENQIAMKNKNIYLVSRIVDGVFPDYKQIIPKEFTTEITLLRQDVLDALKLSTIFSDKFNQVNMRVVSKDGLLSVTTKNNDVGENENIINSVVEGDDVEINFNHKYIYDVFQVISTDSICLQFTGKNRPMVIRPIGDTTFIYLVMPMNK